MIAWTAAICPKNLGGLSRYAPTRGIACDPSTIPAVYSWAIGGTGFLRSYIMQLSERIPPGPPVELPVRPRA